MKRFDFNKILIIESIDPKQTNLYQVGEDLKAAIDKKISDLRAQGKDMNGISCDLIHISSMDKWNELWDNMVSEAENGCYPIIHFVCHGSKDGMSIFNSTGYEIIQWENVILNISRVNKITKNNTFVTMCVCHGFFSLLKLYSATTIPFCGIIASTGLVYTLQAIFAYTDFYSSLLTNEDLTEAYKKINDVIKFLRQKPVYKDIDLIIKLSDELFVESYKKYISDRIDPEKAKLDFIKGIESSPDYKDLTPEEKAAIVEKYMSNFPKFQNETYRIIRDRKFMLDKYPEEIDRYDFPDKIIED